LPHRIVSRFPFVTQLSYRFPHSHRQRRNHLAAFSRIDLPLTNYGNLWWPRISLLYIYAFFEPVPEKENGPSHFREGPP
jgi:hypothetical protein